MNPVLTGDEFAAWLRLFDAALDQPQPSRDLRGAIERLRTARIAAADAGRTGFARGRYCAICGADDWFSDTAGLHCAACRKRKAEAKAAEAQHTTTEDDE